MDFKKAVQIVQAQAVTAYEANKHTKTLIWVYYCGHGVMKNTTFAVCDKAARRFKTWYPLEK